MTEPGVPAPAEAGPGPTDRADEQPEVGAAAPAAGSPETAPRPDEPARSGGSAESPASPEAGRGHVAVHRPRVTGPMVAVLAGVIALDQVTKWWAQRELADGRSVEVVGSLLKLTLTYNSGMAFSRGTGLGPVIGVVAVVVIVVLLASLRRETSRLGQAALAAVIGGAVGNLLDRLFREGQGFLGGSVVDFLQLPHWPVFNVADMAVTLGGLTLVLGAWRAGRPPAADPPGAP